MKEETNENGTIPPPTEKQMNDMHQNAWLDFHADAQQAKQDLSRRYAKMVNTFGSYKKMPDGVKEILKQDYAAHEAKWGENGDEMQKRFGVNDPNPKIKPTEEQSQKRQEFLQNLKEQRQQQPSRHMEHEPF